MSEMMVMGLRVCVSDMSYQELCELRYHRRKTDPIDRILSVATKLPEPDALDYAEVTVRR